MKKNNTLLLLVSLLITNFLIASPAPLPRIYNNLPSLTHYRLAQLKLNRPHEFWVFSHGRPGELLVMGEWKDARQLATWFEQRLDEQIKAIRIFGCEFARGKKGSEAVAYLQRQLNIAISASDNITGKNGDWILEAGQPFTLFGLEEYPFSLQCGGTPGGRNPQDDFDSDGICNDVDIDDDNDGIPDKTECPAQFTNLVANGGFAEVPPVSSGWYVGNSATGFDATTTEIYTYSTTNANSPNTGGMFDDVDGYNPTGGMQNMVVEHNGLSAANVYAFPGNLVGGAVYQFSFDLASRSPTGSPLSHFFIDLYDPVGDTVVQTLASDFYNTLPGYSATSPSYKNFTGTFTIPSTGKYYLLFRNEGSGGAADDYVVDRVGVRGLTANVCDNDGDNSANYQDLDSDGDGCSDAREGAATSSTVTNFQFTGAVGANGLDNSLETATDNGIINYASTYDLYALYPFLNLCADTDGDGAPDVIQDIDDDDDGVPNATETPGCYYNVNEWNTRVKPMYGVAITSSLTTTTGNFDELVDSIANATAVTFSASPAQPIANANVYLFNFIKPVRLTALYLKFNTTSQFAGTTKLQGSNTNNGSDWVDLSAAISQAAVTNTTTNGGVVVTTSVKYPVTLNTGTSYKYIRITGVAASNIAAQNASEVYFDFNPSAYVPSAYPKTSCTVDTDGDGFINSIDRDSDNDGCSDAFEAGATSSTAPNYKFTGVAGVNGLKDSLETAPDNGFVIYNSTYSRYAVSNFRNLCADTDGDGVFDLDDVDDDNDGVPDAVEAPSCFYTATEAIAPVAVSTGLTSTVNSVAVTPGADIPTLHNGVTTSVAAGNHVISTGQALTGANIYTVEFPTAVNLTSLNVIGGTANWGSGTAAALYGSNDNVNWTPLMSTALGTTTATTKIFTVNQNAANYLFYRIQGAAGTGGAITNYEVTAVLNSGTYNPSANPKNDCTADVDSDNLFNTIDADSDNDGCSDALEAGATSNTTPNYQFTGEMGANGLKDSLETTADNGMVIYTSTYNRYAVYRFLSVCDNSDNDAVFDLNDIDDDNDGVLDAVEAPSCYYTSTEANTYVSVTSALTSPDDDQGDGDIQLLHDGALTTYTFNFAAGQPINGSALFIIKYPTQVALTSLTINNTTTFGTGTSARLQGSSDSVTWTDASVSVSLANTSNKVFTSTNTNAYRYYRILGDGGAANTALTTTIGEITSVVAGTYNPSAHPKNTCTTDTDNDGITNTRDFDSDGDGCSDAVEANVARQSGGPATEAGVLKNGSNGMVTSETNTSNAVVSEPYGNNGFADNIETATESGAYNATYTYANATDGIRDADCEALSEVLPVRLLSFTATLVNEKVLLAWKTASEINNDYFDLERSPGGNTWNAIGRVKGKNTPGVHQYNFTDERPLAGTAYYRLKQRDFDGTFSYSEVRTVNKPVNDLLKIYPNPAQAYASITMASLRQSEIIICDLLGKTITGRVTIKQTASGAFLVNVQALPNGMYLLKARGKVVAFVKGE